MNNFDWAVTVAMGALVVSGIILKDVHLSEVMLAIALLLFLQYLLTKIVMQIVRAALFQAVLKFSRWTSGISATGIVRENWRDRIILLLSQLRRTCLSGPGHTSL